ncbi:unnamed protein product [Acanthoscelides obtectus]|uniref:Osteopetrosis-associated transmembrane protein 1 n=1 Tax=Acanthoscelides obtectus TaxID=200917 RepID=A0A9P0LJU6_ACAOB|nr:unnamed protein product [Acanthoscelides obtectus]CAK1664338.1 Osteopetrosis-associated transmembrane protein 1 [Acanthoscelides obtectus]
MYLSAVCIFLLVAIPGYGNRVDKLRSISKYPDANCTDLRQKFANASARFTVCSIDHSRPITFCESCVQSYLDVVESYQNMSKFGHNNTRCIDNFVNRDRLQIVQSIYDANIDLWKRAKCNECYEDESESVVSTSNTTTQFIVYYNHFMNCINKSKIEELCLQCMGDYITLDSYYAKISNINDNIGMCMDIVDLMNNTWTYWSTQCCKYRRHNEVIFIATSIAVLILTSVFYLIVQFCEEKKAPTIMQQSRFAESFSSSSRR